MNLVKPPGRFSALHHHLGHIAGWCSANHFVSDNISMAGSADPSFMIGCLSIIKMKTKSLSKHKKKILKPKRIEYKLEGNLLEKSVKRPFCCTVSILQVYFPYLCSITFWALEYHFIENLKLMLKKTKL